MRTERDLPYQEAYPSHQLRVRFVRRNGGPAIHDPENGIPYQSIVHDVRTSIDDFYPRLTSEFGWSGWPDDSIRDVTVRDLGPGMYGVAALEGRDMPYIVISPRVFDATRELSQLRRRGTVLHELIHLKQFQTPLFLHFYKPLKYNSWDPNWWLHESSALATEVIGIPEYPIAFRKLWEWVTRPHLALDTDKDGHRALPFLLYLMNEIALDLPASLYRYSPDQTDSMLATDILSSELAGRGLDFQKVFLGYCAAVAPQTGPMPDWLEPIISLLGRRSFSERYQHYDVHSHCGWPIEHLACRYFRFAPPNSGEPNQSLEIRITEINHHPELLLGQIDIVDEVASEKKQPIHLQRCGNELTGVIRQFNRRNIKNAVLTIANCGHGTGWAKYNDLRFKLSAKIMETS